MKIKGPPRTFPCTAQIIWNPGSAAASPTPAESSTQPAEKQSVYGEESGGRMLMSQKNLTFACSWTLYESRPSRRRRVKTKKKRKNVHASARLG